MEREIEGIDRIMRLAVQALSELYKDPAKKEELAMLLRQIIHSCAQLLKDEKQVMDVLRNDFAAIAKGQRRLGVDLGQLFR